MLPWEQGDSPLKLNLFISAYGARQLAYKGAMFWKPFCFIVIDIWVKLTSKPIFVVLFISKELI